MFPREMTIPLPVDIAHMCNGKTGGNIVAHSQSDRFDPVGRQNGGSTSTSALAGSRPDWGVRGHRVSDNDIDTDHWGGCPHAQRTIEGHIRNSGGTRGL